MNVNVKYNNVPASHMKKFIRIKTIRGNDYAYEITPYYDPETKNTKQKSKYLGTYKNGEIIPKKPKLPQRCFDHGEFLPLNKIIQELKIDTILKEFLPNTKVKTLLALAMNRVINPVAMQNFKAWYEATSLTETFGELPISSQTLSDFLEMIGQSSIHMEFAKEFIKEQGTGQPLLYDITSLSSTSTLMDIL